MTKNTQIMPALLTYEDYCLIPNDGKRHEIIEGVHYVSPSPQSKHQRVVGNLYFLLRQFLDGKKLGVLYISPLDVVFSNHNVVQPDLLFISNARQKILEVKNVQGAPDLLIEVLSEGNRRYDEVVKRKLYASFEVSEYWIVDPVFETIKIFQFTENKYERIAELHLENDDELTTALLPGFACSLPKVFE